MPKVRVFNCQTPTKELHSNLKENFGVVLQVYYFNDCFLLVFNLI